MNYLSAEKLSKSYGERILFEEVSFGLEEGQKVALVGVNGCGKSTLLKIMAGLDQPDDGAIVVNKSVRLAYLDQRPEFDNKETILQAVLQSNDPIAQLVQKYEHELTKSSSADSSTETLSELIDEMDRNDAWNYEQRVREILGKLGLEEFDSTIGTLSGGQKKRVGLAKILIEKPDLIILDEPTNHLDLDSIEWLEKYLAQSHMAIIMVTHDRYFLESVTNEIVELDQQKLHRYAGNYSYFLEKKAERASAQQAEKDKAKNLMKKELEWIRRQPKARGTKAKYRIDAFEGVKEKATKSVDNNKLELSVKTRRQGGKILELEHVSKSYDGQVVVSDFSYIFKKGERVGIVGKNGSGKSTFLNLLTGNVATDTGEVIKGQSIEFGYYQQHEAEFPAGKTVIDIVKEVAEIVTMADNKTVTVSKFLTFFNFPPSMQHDYIEKLSGGEKRRLQLLLVLIKNPNFLILDEPTNDLDLVTLRTLEDFLTAFNGCLVVVSHDRYFMDQLVDHLFVFEKDTPITDFPGNYSDYRLSQEQGKNTASKEIEEKVKVEKVKQEKRKMSFNEKREFEQLDDEILKLGKQKEEIITNLNLGNGDHSTLAEWGKELKMLEDLIDQKEMRWLELSELAQ